MFRLIYVAIAAVAATAQAPDNFLLDLNTDIDGMGVVRVNITRAWAPIGVDHLHALVQDKFFDGAAFFRVVGGFIVQFGIAGTPAENVKWQSPIKDDPVVQSNLQWTLSYATAGPNTRTTQLFVNYKDNIKLDGQGFAPIGKVVKGQDYLLRVRDPTPGDSNGVEQDEYEHKGDTWIRQQYPEINFIRTAEVPSSPSKASSKPSSSLSVNDATLRDDFQHWVDNNGKRAVYATFGEVERERRFVVFQQNVHFIDAHNRRASLGAESFTLAMNGFGDMTRAEFKEQHRVRARMRGSSAAVPDAGSFPWNGGRDMLDPPKTWDWEAKGAVTNVKNQFEPVSCGACWAFSAVAGMEGKYFIDGNKLTSFSSQEIVDCTLGGADSCQRGGEMHDGVEQVAVNQKQRINTNTQYPYTGKSNRVCHFDAPTAVLTNITGYSNVTVGDEQALVQAVLKGVIPAAINADADSFMFYSGGVINVKNCPSKADQLDHGVAIVGYGVTPLQEPYWLVKNSYGEYWGEKGYFRVTRGKNMCGIATDCILVL